MSLQRDGGLRLRAPPAGKACGAGRPKRAAFVRGWRVLAGAFIMNLVGFGAIHSHAAFADDLVAAFGATHATSSLVFALSGACCFLVSGLTGPLADRIGRRPLAILGMATVALGLMTASMARSMTEVVICYGVLIGLGAGFVEVPVMAAVQRSFVVGRGLASGIAAAGGGFGAALVPPMADLLAGPLVAGYAMEALGGHRVPMAVPALLGLAGVILLDRVPRLRGP